MGLYITGGLLFKIYIVGETIKVVRRFSLPNISKHKLSKVDGLFRFPRVSCAAASADDTDLDPNIAGETPKTLPPRLLQKKNGKERKPTSLNGMSSKIKWFA